MNGLYNDYYVSSSSRELGYQVIQAKYKTPYYYTPAYH